MYRSVCVSVALLTVLVLTVGLPMGQACPRSCNCYQASEVHCTFRSLLTIPPGLPAHTRRINLGFNSISRIHDGSLAGLKKVELLMLHSNDIHHLPDVVFRDMKSLQILKLSYNKLKEISSALTFSGLTSLLRLYLDHNLLEHIHPRALLQLPSLRLLRLQGNRLHQLHPHSLCTLSLLNTYYFSTLRHLDLSNNSLTTLPRETLATAPLLENLVLQANPWSCDCRMNWFLSWSLAHPGIMKCPSDPQCPICDSPSSLQGQSFLEKTDLPCALPVIHLPGRDTPLETEISEIQSSESFREPLGFASLGLSDQHGNSVDLSCNITHSSESHDIAPLPDLSRSSSSPLPLALSLSLECPVERPSYEKLWRILAYYSETAVRLEREIMLSKAPALAYRYRQAPETDGYYHTGVKTSVKARPQWLLQPAISIQLNRAQSNGHKVQLIYSTRVSAHPDPTSHSSASSPTSHPWVLISSNHSTSALVAAAGSKVELRCPLRSSGTPKVQWILPDGSKHVSPVKSLDRGLWASGLLLHKVQLSDAGIYYCVAQAGRDVDVLPLNLAVEESSVPPSGEQVGPPITTTVGEPVSLSCKASGSPTPLISWMLPNGNVVWRGLAVSGGLTIQSNGSLSLPKPSQRDAGHYRCIAINQYGSDSLSMHLELHSQHPPPLRMSFPRGPQSAAGRSTKIRAPLLDQVEEGSGDEEEERTLITNSKRPRPPQPSPNRRYPIGKPRRRGPMREGLLRRGGEPVSFNDQRRNRFENKHRVATKKQRIDPQKWADLLAKIRQKTAHSNNNESIAAGKPTAEPVRRAKVGDIGELEGNDDTERGRAGGAGVKAEAEGSSGDDVDLQEEGLQPIHTVHTEMQTHTETKKDAETDTELKKGTERTTETPAGKETHMLTEKAAPQTETVTNSDTVNELVTYKPISGTNEIIPERGEGDEQEEKPNPSRVSPQKPRQELFHNSVPNSRTQSPWNTRRRIGQRRRIINRHRGRPLNLPQPLPNPVNPTSQTVTPETTTDQINTTSTTSLVILSTQIGIIRTGVALNSLSPPVSNTLDISTSKSTSPSLTPSPFSFTSLSPTHKDMMTHSANIPDTAESTLFDTPTPTPAQSDTAIVQMHGPDTDTRMHTHGIQTHTKTHTALGKHVDRPSGKHNEELERNLSFVSHSSTSLLPTLSSITSSTSISDATADTAAAKMSTTYSTALKSTHSGNSAGSATSASTTTVNKDTFPTTTTVTPMTTSPMISTTTTIIIPTSSTTISTTTTLTSTPTTTPSLTTTPTSSTSSTIPSTTTTPTASSTTVSFKAIPTTPNSIATTTTTATTATTTKTTSTTSTRITISPQTSPTTVKTATPNAPSTTTTTMRSASAVSSSRERPSTGHFQPRGRPVSGAPNQSRPPTEWKNPGANSIPDSHSSRPRWPPSPPLPAVPGAPVVRSRPRIADPHIRTVSFPSESTARLACEAQGEPKPSITWTKVSTGAVMSIHSRAQRFEVLPNGTLVIQNVQLQDRGTYICSALSSLGRDRLLTTLEVWTRPPRMQLASYREVTIHQGGEVHLDCQADGVPTPLLSWVLPDRSVLTSTAPSTGRVTIDTNGTLYISVTLPSDRGVYRCVASNSAGAASASVRVHVSSLPPVMQQPREEHLPLSPGMPVYAHCSARGAPPPSLRWRIPDGTLIRPSQFLHDNLFVLPNGTLHIRKVGPKDSGNYECTASNAIGTDKRIVRVEIEKGESGEKRQEGARNEGEKSVAFSPSLHKDRNLSIPRHSSNAFNSPRLSPSSPSNGSTILLITPSSSHSSADPRQPNSTNSPLKINKTVTASHTYLSNINKTKLSPLSPTSTGPKNNTKVSPSITNRTRATNSSLSDKNRASAALNPLPVSPFSKAHIVSTSPSITTVYYGSGLQLHCSVTGNPSPIIIWRTPSKKLVDMHFSFDRRLKVHPNGTLSVQAVIEKDAGDYLCIARNKVADDYRLLRVSVATKPAKIEPKQPPNQMVLFGKPLKVDCQASGLPDPAVHWSLPDGTMVNSVLQREERGGRARRLTVFDNGTLLVPAVGKGEEGEYTCYAENQGGQDTMKIKVKVMMTSPPTFTEERSYHLIKIRQGATATVRCQVTGDPAQTVTWFSPTHRVIPRSLGSRFYPERVVVVSDGTLEVRQAQKTDAGNYTCRASNSAGERSMVVGLEVETPNYGHVGGRGWSTSNGPGSGHSSRSGDNINNSGKVQYGFTNGVTSKLGSNNSSNNAYSGNNGKIGNIVPNTGIATSVFNPAVRSNSENGFNRPVSGTPTQLGSTVISVGLARNIDIKTDNSGINRSEPDIVRSGNNVGNIHSTVRGDSLQRNSGTNNNNEVIAGKASNDANPSRDSGQISGISRNVGIFSISGSGFSRSSSIGVTNDNSRNSGGSSSTRIATSNTGTKNSTNTIVGVITTVKHRAMKGQTVLLPCPSQGSPPPRLAWLLPGNGVLPAPYYGSRLTVHRNGSLELRGVRVSDGGTLVCVVRGERGETRIQVELEVSEQQVEARSPHRELAVEKPAQESAGLKEASHSGVSLDSGRSVNSRPVFPERLPPRITVTPKPVHRGLSLPVAPHPVGSPPRSAGPLSEPTVSTRTAPLVSIINGETLRLPCPAPQTRGYTQGSLSWTMPSGKVLSRGGSGDSGRYLVQDDGTLTVQQASVFDRGTYTCRSTSYDSSSVSVITVPVIVIAYPPRITMGPSPVTYTRPGVAVELPCLTIATPRATVTWETPELTQLRVMGQARIYGNRYLSPQGSLVIQNPTSRDTGFYRCTAKNVIGVDTKATYLHVI
uniref:matrix-remodeling-associated protein 5-like n=1 Tax=Scatophagus argus TaxID=75038 RepID=UPI001ED7D98C|nr:matrix-remodeling-associated protein 5-like [Scatophagus argus]